MPATECPDHTRLTAFFEGTLPTDDHLAVARHIRNCEQCQQSAGATGRSVPTRRQFPDPADTQQVAALPADTETVPTLDRVGPYRIRRLIGRGGMGAVYEAVHERLGKAVAIKVLPRPVAIDPEYLARFGREVKAGGLMDHPNVVRATDAGEQDGVPYLVMELVDGVDLARLVRTLGPLAIPDACDLVRQAAVGLAHAHGRGVIHRDVKPSNLMIATGGGVKVLDLGLAVLVSAVGRVDEQITGPTALGTHDYMAPEQWTDSSVVTTKVDVYGLGCVFFQALVGRPPFAGADTASPNAKKRAHLTAIPPDPAAFRHEVPAPVADLVRLMLAKRPDDRPTCEQVADTLRPFAPATSTLARLVERTKLAPGTGFADGGPTAIAPIAPEPTGKGRSDTQVAPTQPTSTDTTPALPADPTGVRQWELLVALMALTVILTVGLAVLLFGVFR